MNLNYRFIPLLLLPGILIFAFSCNKKDTPVTPTYDLSYTGNLWVGDTIAFQSTAPTTSTFLWKFGDGSTSTLATPVHIYDTIPTYIYDDKGGQEFANRPDTVTLIVNNDVSHPIKKLLPLSPGVERAVGIKTWKRIHYTGSIGNVVSQVLPDTAIPISMNSGTLNVLGIDVSYNVMQSHNPANHGYAYTSLPVWPLVMFVYSPISKAMTIYQDTASDNYVIYSYP